MQSIPRRIFGQALPLEAVYSRGHDKVGSADQPPHDRLDFRTQQ